jgi:putative aldouronate transport system permease protein
LEKLMIRTPRYKILIHAFLIVFSLSFILPLLMVISVSLTSAEDLATYGYRLIPRNFTLQAYRFALADFSKIGQAYLVTASQSVLGTFLGILVMGFVGYVVSRKNCTFRKSLMFFILFTMLFSGGLIPEYIINTQWYGLGDSFWVYIFPTLANGFFIIIFRTFFSKLPEEIFESAHLDGASELTIFFRLVVPMSTPVFAALSFLFLQGRWDEWFRTLLYIRSEELYTLQYLLQRIILEVQFIRDLAMSAAGVQFGDFDMSQMPTESLRYAMVIIAAGPMLVIFPFFQKYFTEGLTVGSVKG